jgi:ABC-type amino acid transport substrate-binding protein
VLTLSATGCGLPWDPQGTLDRVRDGDLHVGVSHNPPWTDLLAGEEPRGKEVDLVRRLAKELNAKIRWHPGGETSLLEGLEQFRLDLVIGGIKKDTPWEGRIGLTRPHTRTDEGKYVLACPPGENGWIVFLDRWLHQQERGGE